MKMGIVFGVVSFIIPLLAIAGGIAVLVYFVKNRDGSGFSLDISMIFLLYTRLIIFISLILVCLGITTLLKTGFSYLVDERFSYDEYALYEEVWDYNYDVNDVDYKYDENKIPVEDRVETQVQKKDIIQGITLTLVGTLFLLLHVGAGMLVKDAKEKFSWIYTGYIIVTLVMYSLVSLIALPVGLYLTLQYALLENAESFSGHPGDALAVGIAFTPVWIYFLIRLGMKVRESKKS